MPVRSCHPRFRRPAGPRPGHPAGRGVAARLPAAAAAGRTFGLRYRLLSLGLVLLALAFAPMLQAAPARYAIDPDHLSIGFLVDHVGYAKTLGMFRKASGSYTFDEEAAALTDLEVLIETDSVFTNHRKRDDHLKNADFLNSREFPRMRFTAANARRVGERDFQVDGELELLGVKRPVTLTATWNKSAPSPFPGSPYVMGVSARGSFQRSEFGMRYGVDNGWVGDTVELIIEFEAVRQ